MWQIVHLLRFMKKILWVAGLMLALLTACDSEAGQQTVTGNGVLTTVTRDSETFSKVETTGDITVMYLKGSTPSVKITCDENLADYIETSVNGNQMSVKAKSGVVLTSKNLIRVLITSPSLNTIDLLGSGIVSADEMTGQNISVTINGTGRLSVKNMTTANLDLKVYGKSSVAIGGVFTNITSYVKGDGNVVLTGTNAQTHTLTMEGKGAVKCYDLKSTNAKVVQTGACTAELSVANKLDVDAAQGAYLYYKGSPTITANLHNSAKMIESN